MALIGVNFAIASAPFWQVAGGIVLTHSAEPLQLLRDALYCFCYRRLPLFYYGYIIIYVPIDVY